MPSAAAKQIEVAAGTTSFLFDGELPASGDAEFVIAQQAGALMLAQAIARDEDLRISVFRADTGEEIKDQHPHYSVWVSHVPASLGYLLVVHSAGKAVPYTMKIETPRRIYVDPRTSAAEIKGVAPANAVIAYVAPPSKALDVVLTSPSKDSYLTIYNLEGQSLLTAHENSKQFKGPRLIPTDDVLLRVNQGPDSGEFTLKIRLQ